MMARLAALILTVLAALALWNSAQREPGLAERTHDLAAMVRCPDCSGVSAAESSSAMALSVRAEIERLLRAGVGDDDILRHFRQRYGDWILLSPPMTGLPLALWALPAAAVLALMPLAARRRRPPPRGSSAAYAPVAAKTVPVVALGVLAVVAGAVVIRVSHEPARPVTADQPDDPVARGRLLASAGDHEGAVRAYREALRRRPDDRAALSLLGLQLIETGRAAEAVSLLRKVADRRSRDADLLLVLGTAQLATEPERGRRTLARFLTVAPAGHPAVPRIRDLLLHSVPRYGLNVGT
ncbi:cytochrome c-type biogenesis protein CcmH [Nonomuraea wenchangensis]|uniref:Cytochrome c-type biogenesis protein n=1 Tax=Nonomuraea wenchangensis TaxID=568860 RepID=A0A1I0BZT3_9ACTN|nr:tetratricopeptide repeat protein [Nonomuraea wenchangensis]SET12715.1 Cytochrome c-type biogenesis protein CcmH/NrfF [Nonomuraea wenchangensis]